MTEKSSLNNNWKFVLGFTDEETVMIDFDNTPLKSVKYWASRTMKWFKLEGYLILRSSPDNYHVVFNRKVSWRENVHIVSWVALLSNNPMLQKWVLMQGIKEGSTLRMSPKRDKKAPRIAFRHGREDGQIKSFLKYRKLVKGFIKKLKFD